MLHAEQRAEHIGIERRGVAVGGLFRHPAGLAFGAGAVDGRIQTTETRDGLIDQAAHIVLAAHVGADELRFAAELAQLSSQRLADVLMAAGNDDAVAFPRKSKGCCTSNPSQRAGNQDNGVAHGSSPSWYGGRARGNGSNKPEFGLMGPAGACNRQPEISASAQDETGVTGIGGFLALLQVQWQPAGVDQHLALLAWDVGAHVPGLRAGEQSRSDQFGDMVAPGFLRFLCRLDAAEVVAPHVLDARDDEVALQLGAGRPVAERRWALWAVDIEQIRKVRARHAQMRARAAGPFRPKRLVVRAANVDAGQPAREEIKPRRKYENVELNFPGLRLDTRWRHSFDWGFEQVDNSDIRMIVRLVVVLL